MQLASYNSQPNRIHKPLQRFLPDVVVRESGQKPVPEMTLMVAAAQNTETSWRFTLLEKVLIISVILGKWR